jgi:uncharacterized circularly permuted ATP-grasp superfamily protein
MKTTKNTVLAKKIEKLVATKELRKGTIVMDWLNLVLNGTKEFRPVFTQGATWKHSSLVDKTNELQTAFRKLGLTFTTTNDASRGGKTGVRVDLITKVLC